MPMELIGAAGLAVELKQTYDRQLLSRAIPNFVYNWYGLKKAIPQRGGKSIEFRRFELISTSTTALTEGTPPGLTNATVSNVAATVSQYGQYSQISDLVETQSYDPLIGEYVDAYGIAMADALDQLTRDVVVAGTTVQFASTAGSRFQVGSGQYINSAEIREAVNTLKRQNAKPLDGGKFVCILHPDNTRDLFADPNVVAAFQNAAPRSTDNPLFSGVLGDYMGVTFVETTQVRTYGSGLSQADVYMVMFLGKEAYGVIDYASHPPQTIIHPRGSGGHTDPLEQYSTIGWKAAHTAVRLNNNFMVRLECNASQKTAA